MRLTRQQFPGISFSKQVKTPGAWSGFTSIEL
jgi:hypothetical protein